MFSHQELCLHQRSKLQMLHLINLFPRRRSCLLMCSKGRMQFQWVLLINKPTCFPMPSRSNKEKQQSTHQIACNWRLMTRMNWWIDMCTSSPTEQLARKWSATRMKSWSSSSYSEKARRSRFRFILSNSSSTEADMVTQPTTTCTLLTQPQATLMIPWESTSTY